jgi:hypothetical protein
MRRRGAGIAALIALSIACGSSGSGTKAAPTSAPKRERSYPSSIVVLGHSGATGFNSDPAKPATDARQNSWATGDNPDVDSIYSRLLALNPAVRGHKYNVAIDGTGVDQLGSEADQALAMQPRPELFLIETVDNDIRCDGTDAANVASFSTKLEAALRKISTGAPRAEIFILSSPWSTTEAYVRAVQQLPASVRASSTGTKQCDLFDTSGAPVPTHQQELERITVQYLDVVKSVCARFKTCRYDNGALHDIAIDAADVTSDGFHLTVAGQRKVAAVEWRALGLGS